MAPLFGYWDVRGIVEPIRLLLNHVGEEFVERRYEVKSPGPHQVDRSDWLNEKFSLGLQFPNLPYYIDGDVQLTQSLAILRYLARKHKLDGSTEREKQELDVLEQQIHDLSYWFLKLVYSPDFASKKHEYTRSLPDKLRLLEKWLDGKMWFVGDRITYVDFFAYEALDQHLLFDETCLDQFPQLQAFTSRVEELPNVKKYLNSSIYKKWPIYSPLANWGYYK